MQETGGLRKIRMADEARSKGKRGGIRIIYYWCDVLAQFWLFTLYDKGESDDLTAAQRKSLKQRLGEEVSARTSGIGLSNPRGEP